MSAFVTLIEHITSCIPKPHSISLYNIQGQI